MPKVKLSISKRRKIKEICKRYKILAVYLFGSMANTGIALLNNKTQGEFDPLADLDVGIVFIQAVTDPKERIKIYGRLYADLSELFSPLPLDLVFLQETGVMLQFEAINSQLICSSDENQRIEYEERVIKYYQDWKPIYDIYTKEVLEAIIS